MKNEIAITHKSFNITFCENIEEWVCSEINYQNKSLSAVKKRIDDFLKQESEYKNMPAINISQRTWGTRKFGCEVIITSVADNGDVWIKVGNSREKIGKCIRYELAVANDANKEKVAMILANAEKIRLIQAENDAIKASFEPVFGPEE